MNLNLVFGKAPNGQDIMMIQHAIGPLDIREFLRQIKAQQPEAWRDVNYEIVRANGSAKEGESLIGPG